MASKWNNEVTFRSYGLPVDFKNLIGWARVRFWGCENEKIKDGLNFGPSLAEGEWESKNLT